MLARTLMVLGAIGVALSIVLTIAPLLGLW